MLLTRSLPLQFLLPAWSPGQLIQASQRARNSTSSSDVPIKRPATSDPEAFKRWEFQQERIRHAKDGVHEDSLQALAEEKDRTAFRGAQPYRRARNYSYDAVGARIPKVLARESVHAISTAQNIKMKVENVAQEAHAVKIRRGVLRPGIGGRRVFEAREDTHRTSNPNDTLEGPDFRNRRLRGGKKDLAGLEVLCIKRAKLRIIQKTFRYRDLSFGLDPGLQRRKTAAHHLDHSDLKDSAVQTKHPIPTPRSIGPTSNKSHLNYSFGRPSTPEKHLDTKDEQPQQEGVELQELPQQNPATESAGETRRPDHKVSSTPIRFIETSVPHSATAHHDIIHRKRAAYQYNLKLYEAEQQEAVKNEETNKLYEVEHHEGVRSEETNTLSEVKQQDDTKDHESKEQETETSEPLSLFDELFPEERQAKLKREKDAEERLHKLPAFNWNVAAGLDREEIERQKRRQKYESIPKRQEPRAVLTPPRKERSKTDSVLLLNACSNNLEESDFFRLGPRGEHIEGWTSGITKVIPARNSNTLEKLGYYYIVCSDNAAARAYSIRISQLHKLATSFKAFESSGLPIPKAHLLPGEDPVKLLQGFSLVPAYNKLSLRSLQRPFSVSAAKLLSEGGPIARLARRSQGGELVLFSVDQGHINQYDLLEALSVDGRRRNMHWKFGGQKANRILKLSSLHYNGATEGPSDALEEGIEPEASKAHGAATSAWKTRFKNPSRYAIMFKDRTEARRFVREWHRRPFPVQGVRNPGDEPIPIVNAEILW